MSKPRILILSVLLITTLTEAYAEEKKQGFWGESELGSTVTTGNTSTNNLAGKTENKYGLGADLWTLAGRYLRSNDQGVETALSWDVGLRYDKVITDRLTAFLGYKIEADPYSGYARRDSIDLGSKYYFIKSESFYWLGEGGYRYSKTHIPGADSHDSFLRFYTETQKTLDKNSYGKIWVEYLPNLTHNEAYLVNAEASLSGVLTELFSLKMSYLAKYQNAPAAGYERTDTIFMTTLVAKY